ncbi:MAG: DUF4234 domain-containing protein [Candidatus Bathyarchaeota archaeon]|nr:MAG: DUF4234 domain-containing protein [Candidatus Bathyarchaeota archaeon]
MTQMLTEIEKNIESRRETDRIMWFSMWILLSVASFGVAWFLMIYFLIKRRNDHFLRQDKLETLISTRLRQLSEDKLRHQNPAASIKTENPRLFRNAQVWALSTLLVFPAFFVLYFLETDLHEHEEREHTFLEETISLAQDSGVDIRIDGFPITKKFASDRYLILTVATCGFAALYWLYRIFNDYNQHFNRQWKIEDDILKFFKSVNNLEPGW